MNLAMNFVMVLLTAAVLNNSLFTRGLGVSRTTLPVSNQKTTAFLGLCVTLLGILAVLPAWPLVQLARTQKLSEQLKMPFLTSLISLVCICVVYVLLFLVSRAVWPKFHYHFRKIGVLAAFNTTLFGTLVITFIGRYDYLQSIAFVVGAGLGYTGALMLVNEGRRRVMLADLPRAFRGIPVMLLYAGIFSLALYGLIGHSLAT